ncbi:hypothetical protein ANANG_G00090420 [Anguilla anguilla]|uniref:Ig-like domain-containing protein n=1 Tax=Anguilla anguilla TaxID=7936 RepID=A0A9D3S1H7_ANGAN|nr:hypothetical protein ANANG_G00090420 [Anguilla anguilla]
MLYCETTAGGWRYRVSAYDRPSTESWSGSVRTEGSSADPEHGDPPRARAPLLAVGTAVLLLGCLVLPSHADSLPSFIKSPDDQIGISGGVASFVCQAVGEPKPRITWMKKGKKVSSQRFEVIEFDDGSGSVLRIQPLRTHRDEAIYECTATNSAGEINTSAKLTVLEGKPPSTCQLPYVSKRFSSGMGRDSI